MLVELFGPPGAGKSTLTPLIVDWLRYAGHQARSVHITGYQSLGGTPLSRRQMQWDRILALTGQPYLAAEAARCLTSEGTGLALSWLINLARRNRAMQRLEQRDRATRAVTIVEEGPLSALCLAGCAHKSAWNPNHLLKRIVLPEVAVYLSVDQEVANDRVQQRAGRFSQIPREELFQSAAKYLTYADALQQQLPIPVLPIQSGEQAPRELASRIASSLIDRRPSE